jgi:putative tryptophan/tyrosine transport system substrate-binding protein
MTALLNGLRHVFPLLVLFGHPLEASAQPAQDGRKVPLVAYLGPGPSLIPGTTKPTPFVPEFRKGMRDLGYIEGQNIRLEVRLAEGRPERVPVLAVELVALQPDVIVAALSASVHAFEPLTRTIPIVMISAGDPIGQGFIESMARPGGNITGLAQPYFELYEKMMQVLKEILPNAGRIGVLYNPQSPLNVQNLQHIDRAATLLGVRIVPLQAMTPEGMQSALDAAVRDKVDGVFVTSDPVTLGRRDLINDFAKRHRLPTMYTSREFVAEGGFATYGPDFLADFPRAAVYVDKILKGAKPADLPVEAPADYRLVINLKTADAIGLKIPDAILARADEVIE